MNEGLTLLLNQKTAIICGAGGAIGSAIAQAYAREGNHQPSYDEVANIATFAASDWARTITASEINITGGAVID
jgi:NADP-dependent 3-hydroxy acid dehydrogenase YdfG